MAEETEGQADFPLARRALAVAGRAPAGVPLEKLESWLRDRNLTEAELESPSSHGGGDGSDLEDLTLSRDTAALRAT